MPNKDLIISSDATLEQKVLGLIACVGQEQKSHMIRLLHPLGLSLVQLQILHTLDLSPNGVLTVNQLKSFMIDDSPNVSRALNKLMDSGLVTKERSQEDQRTVHVSITEKGRSTHHQADDELSGVKIDLSDQDMKSLYDLLVKI